MKDTIIFDLDGTLLNTLEDLTDSVNYALQKFNYEIKNIDEIKSFVGDGVAKLIERAIPNGKKNSDFEDCLLIFKEHYRKNSTNKTKPYDGIVDMLQILKMKRYKIAVVSNKFDEAVKSLCHLYFKDLIDFAVGESISVKKKPAPDGILKVVDYFNTSLEKVLYVGDSDTDIYTAQNAQVDYICVTWGYRDKALLEKIGCVNYSESVNELANKILDYQ